MRSALLGALFSIALLAQAAPSDDNGRWRHGTYRGRPVTFKVVDGWAIYQGDIILGRAENLQKQPGQSKDGHRDALVTSDYTTFWTKATIPYVIDPAIKDPNNILAAIQHWRDNTLLQFVQRTNQPNWVTFKPSSDNSICASSAIGMTGGEQFIFGSELCPTGNFIHEIGHAAGLQHEQARSDRNGHVKILFENMSKIGTTQYDASAQSDDVDDYDYGSIMHYGVQDFSKNGQPTMETVPPGIPVGQTSALSAGDIDAINQIYGNVQATTIATNPPGLQVTVDGQAVQTPKAFQWPVGSTHTLDVDPQTDANARYTFGRWSNGGVKSQTVTVANTTTLITANFVRSVHLNVPAIPSDGGTITISPASDDGYYRDGTPVEISAMPAPGYYFAYWTSPFLDRSKLSNYAAMPLKTIVDDRAIGLTANFSKTAPVRFTSSVPATAITVDGKRYFLPANFLWDAGSTHQAEVDNTFPSDSGVARQVFVSWNDGGDRARAITADANPITYAAKYRTQRELDLTVYPSGTGTLKATPDSPDGFYDDGTVVQVTAVPSQSYALAGFIYDLTGTANGQSVTMSDWNYVLGLFAKPSTLVPYGMMNAAALQPTFFAPGEMVTFYVPGFGPDSPATATPSGGRIGTELANSRVLFDGTAAAVTSASKGQVTAVVPYFVGLENSSVVQVEYNGTRTPAVRWSATTSTAGVFTQTGTGIGQGRILNEDGSANSSDNPAARGSVVTIYATGEGFETPVPNDGQIAADPLPTPYNVIEVRIGGKTADLQIAGGSPGEVAGIMRVKVRVPDSISAGNTVPVIVSVNGDPSQGGVTMSVK